MTTQNSMKSFKSFAEWPPGTISGSSTSISDDSHDTREQAEGVCRRLQCEGFGGNGKIFPIRTWVEEIEPRPAEDQPTIKESLSVQVSERHRECAGRAIEAYKAAFTATESFSRCKDAAAKIIAQHETAEIERLRTKITSLEVRLRSKEGYASRMVALNQKYLERAKALEEGLNKAVITLDFIATASGHPASGDAESTLAEIKPLLQLAKTSEPSAAPKIQVTLGHQLRASKILNKHFPEMSRLRSVICHLAETLAYQEAPLAAEIERLTHELEHVWKPAAVMNEQYARSYETQRDQLQYRVNELEKLLNTPEFFDFIKAVPLEAAHQVERWGEEHDAKKEPQDWFWVIGYLAGKALRAHLTGDLKKALHHCISTAAVCANWHKAILTQTKKGANETK